MSKPKSENTTAFINAKVAIVTALITAITAVSVALIDIVPQMRQNGEKTIEN